MRRTTAADPFDWPVPRKQVGESERAQVADELRKRYDAGASIRDLVRASGRSYGFVRGLLVHAGVTLRPPKGGHSKP
ncbi:helix-turn-helix domain-containing protein [Streptomyces sp. NPDC055103]